MLQCRNSYLQKVLDKARLMTALAEAHARLYLRTKVLTEDVILVVYLYEISITALFGPSLVSSTPTVLNALSLDKNVDVGLQIHTMLQDFSIWLERYIKAFLSDGSVNCSVYEE